MTTAEVKNAAIITTIFATNRATFFDEGHFLLPLDWLLEANLPKRFL
jgi:hypothetical protein